MSFGKLVAIATLSVVGTTCLIAWTENQNETMVSKLQDNAGVSNLNISFKDKTILLNVELSKPMSCKEVFAVLGIEEIPMKGKVYAPVCTTVKPELVVITYKEKNMV